MEGLGGEQRQSSRLRIVAAHSAGTLLDRIGYRKHPSISDRDGDHRLPKFPPQKSGMAEPEPALGGDGLFQGGESPFLDKLGLEGADPGLLVEPGVEGCRVGGGGSQGNGREENREAKHHLD